MSEGVCQKCGRHSVNLTPEGVCIDCACQQQACKSDELLAEYERCLGQAAVYIKQLEATQQWIPVDDNSPPVNQRTLGLLNGEAVFAKRDEEGYWDEEGQIEFFGGEITHWIPIPPSPGWG